MEHREFIFIIFGGNGDLAWKKLHPSLFKLYKENKIKGLKKIISCSRESSKEEFITKMEKEFSKEYANLNDCINVDVNNFKDFNFIKNLEKEKAELIFYLALPPTLFETTIKNIGHVLLDLPIKRKIVIEKPFGYDLYSAKKLNQILKTYFLEKEIFRIDHFLGKDAVQNIFSLRFSNYIFEGIWNKNFIDHVQISALEDIGIEGRVAYYDKFGAFKDMIQNHLTQIMCFIAMEPPCCLEQEEVRNEKVKILKSIRPINKEDIVLGRYEGYTDETKNPHSKTETFAALKLYIDNLRWYDVPFYLRTGKKLARKETQVIIVFKKIPQSFKNIIGCEPKQNKIVFKIAPKTDIILRLEIRDPNQDIMSCPLETSMSMDGENQAKEAYETLLLDIIEGNQTLFLREDEVEKAWEVYEPVIQSWESKKEIEIYEKGSFGPKKAFELIEKDKREWLLF